MGSIALGSNRSKGRKKQKSNQPGKPGGKQPKACLYISTMLLYVIPYRLFFLLGLPTLVWPRIVEVGREVFCGSAETIAIIPTCASHLAVLGLVIIDSR